MEKSLHKWEELSEHSFRERAPTRLEVVWGAAKIVLIVFILIRQTVTARTPSATSSNTLKHGNSTRRSKNGKLTQNYESLK